VGSLTESFALLSRDWLHAGIEHLGYTAFWFAVLQIIFINLLLSGDNAVVIAMACRDLPSQQRRWGLVIGVAVAVILRIVFAGIVARLMLLPYLKLIGGAALIYIAARLIVPQEADRGESRSAARLWQAIWIVAVADIIMSLDNVIAVVALAHGDLLLFAIGLVISIPMIVAGAALIMALLERYPILIWAGAALLGWVAGGVIATDPAVAAHLTASFGEKIAQHTEIAAAGAATLLAVGAGGLWRRLYEARVHAAA
jgi:YjbE family integral membrane protein